MAWAAAKPGNKPLIDFFMRPLAASFILSSSQAVSYHYTAALTVRQCSGKKRTSETRQHLEWTSSIL